MRNSTNKTIQSYCVAFSLSAMIFMLQGCGGSSDNTFTTTTDTTDTSTITLASLGEKLFFDTSLSVPAGQSCSSCHTPSAGFADPDSGSPTSLGADSSSVGTRNSPTASYAAHIPDSTTTPVLTGGQFLDGRAASLEEQAKGPFLNPVEMANASEEDVIAKIKLTDYASDFETLFGIDILEDVATSYDHVADAIAAFERTSVFSPFTSKFDQVAAGTATFTAAEARGQQLFNGRGQCDTCHASPNNSEEVFSDFEFKNIGVPSNGTLLNILSDSSFIDNGLGGVTGNNGDNGKFRTPNLRNIANTAPYMHNGVFNTLTEVVEFYNTRDTTFPDAPEVNQNVDQRGRIGELGLNTNDVDDIVSFLGTLTDQ
ncbi:MAG: cytochrome c peroxidase [Thiotrichaceae bacterium]